MKIWDKYRLNKGDITYVLSQAKTGNSRFCTALMMGTLAERNFKALVFPNDMGRKGMLNLFNDCISSDYEHYEHVKSSIYIEPAVDVKYFMSGESSYGEGMSRFFDYLNHEVIGRGVDLVYFDKVPAFGKGVYRAESIINFEDRLYAFAKKTGVAVVISKQIEVISERGMFDSVVSLDDFRGSPNTLMTRGNIILLQFHPDKDSYLILSRDAESEFSSVNCSIDLESFEFEVEE